MNDKTRESQGEYFRKSFLKYGDSPLALHWNNRERQFMRFKALTNGLGLENKKILDIGCGLGHFLEYLEGRKIKAYTGLDIVEEMIEYARTKHPYANFIQGDFLENRNISHHDMVFISGLFNIKIKNHKRFVEETLIEAWDICDEVLSFNMISDYVDFKEQHLYYANPETIFRFCKKLTKRVSLLHNYLPFEFTLIMSKIPFSPECYTRKRQDKNNESTAEK